ncbi:tetratricopeptide repeat protein [Streptomyces bauhiniae]
MGGKNKTKSKGRTKKNGGNYAGSRFDHSAALGSGTQFNTFVREYAPAPPALASLPELPTEFTGREEDLSFLLDILKPESGAERPVVVVAGLGGVGKTTLAHAAGRESLRQEWFNGVLLVDLRGYDPQPAQAEQTLDSLLRLLGERPENIPPTGPAREVFYRSRLAERAAKGERLLVVADNAFSTEQVKPLLPPAPHGVIVTSRKALPGLGRPRALHQLRPKDAVTLIDLALRQADPDDQRVGEDQAAAERIALACDCLPLALQIVAAQLIQDPGQPLAERARLLSSGEGRLDSLNDGERDLRTVFDQTLETLLPQQQDLFRMLSLNAGPDVSTAAVAALTHQSEPVTLGQLDRLTAAHLVERGPVRNRWRMHDLLRDYAEESRRRLCQENRTARRRYDQAHQRLNDYYVHKAEGADSHLSTSGQVPKSSAFTDRDDALSWLDSERANLIATAHAQSPSNVTNRLGFALRDYLEWRHRSQELLVISALALDTCRALHDRRNEAGAWHNLGSALDNLHRYEEALTAYTTSRSIAEENEDCINQAAAWNGIGNMMQSLHRYSEALGAYEKSREFAEQVNSAHGRTVTWNNSGGALYNLHRFDEALDAHHTARTIAEQADDTDGQVTSWNKLGNALHQLRRYEEALDAYRRARTIAEQTSNTSGRIIAWSGIGNVLHSLHRYAEALDATDESRALAEQSDSTTDQIVAWNNRGSSLRSLHRFEEALTAHDKARALAELTNDTSGVIDTWNGTGSSLEGLYRYPDALAAFREALSFAEQTNNAGGQITAWNNTSIVLRQLHRYDDALAASEKCRVLAEQTNNTDGQIAAWNTTSEILRQINRYDDALAASEKCRVLAEQTNNTDGQIAAWNTTGDTLKDLERYEESLTAQKKAQEIAEQTGDADTAIIIWNSTGDTLTAMHSYEKALTAHHKARTLAEQTNGVLATAISWHGAGVALRGLHRYDEALAAGQRAVSLLRELGDLSRTGEALSELAETLHASGRSDSEVRETWRSAAQSYEKAGAAEKATEAYGKAEASG